MAPGATRVAGVRTKTAQRRRIWGLTATFLAAAAPFLLILPVVVFEARRQAAGEAAVTAGVVIHQADNILLHAEDATHVLSGLLPRPCDEIQPVLRQAAAQQPYFRSLVLVRDDTVYCASQALSGAPLPLAATSVGHLPEGLHILPVAGTGLVPDRPAVIVTNAVRSGTGALAVIDAQYFYDLMTAAARNGRYDIELLLGRNRQPLLDRGERPRPARGPAARTVEADSRAFPVAVRVTPLQPLLAVMTARLWRNYMAFLVLASALCGYAAHRFYGQRDSLAAAIRQGIRAREFYLLYQPVVDLVTGAPRGFEALLRWDHPHDGLMAPDVFIPAAEQAGLIAELTRHIFDLASADLPQLALHPGLHLALNVAAPHIAEAGFVEDVQKLLVRLEAAGAPRLLLEVTERNALPDTRALRENMARLRAAGVRWALDDFGTGHSSLAYLERLNAEFLKLDRTFVAGVRGDGDTPIVLDTIIGLARRLGIAMIAEGVETTAQARYLRSQGVQWAQGYRYAKPMRPAQARLWHQRRARRCGGVPAAAPSGHQPVRP